MKQALKSVLVCAHAVALGGLWLAEPASGATHPLGWGLNADRQASPVPTNVMTDASAIAAGYTHSLAIKDGRAWAWGLNTSGQTNVPVAAQSSVSQVAGGANFSLALKTDGSVVVWGSGSAATNAPASLLTSGVTQIAAGEFHALALKAGGVIAWGSNTFGQTNVPATLTSGVSAVSAGGAYSLALKDNGVQVFGIAATNEESYGIRDVPPEATTGVSAISAGRWHALALKNGGVIAWGAPFFDATNVPAAATSGVTRIAAGDLFSIAQKNDGSIVVWGDDTKGQLPIPSFASNGVSQIAAGSGHCLVVSTGMPPRFVEPLTLPSAYRDQPYTNNAYVRAEGDPSVRYYPSGSWPGWLTLDPTNGTLGGTPTALGISYFSVIASNVYGRATNAFQVSVLERPLGPPIFLTTNLPNGIVNAAYDQQIVITNSGTFSIIDGSLPAGLNMDANGLITGTPRAPETLQFRVLATNVVGGSNRLFEITIDPPAGAPVFATTNPLPSGIVGQPYLLQIEVSNYPTNIGLLSGALPLGLGLTSAGMVTGTPSQVETGNFTMFATNMVGGAETNYTLQILGPPAILTPSPLPDGAPGVPYSQQISATGDPIFSLAGGSLPGGLNLATNGLLSGTPAAAGAFNFTVLATNAYGSTNRVYDLLIGALPVFTTTNPLPNGQVGSAYSLQIAALGDPIFSLFAGSLPGGLNLATNGLLSGTPTVDGAFNFTVRATNDYGWSNRVYDLTILGQLAPSFTERPRYTNGNVRIAWTNPNASGNVQIWRSTNITRNPPPWTNLGVVTTSPWTNVAPPTPSYYRLILVP